MRNQLLLGLVTSFVVLLAAGVAGSSHTIEDPCWGQAVTISGTDGNDSTSRALQAGM